MNMSRVHSLKSYQSQISNSTKQIQSYLNDLDHYIESTSNTCPNLHFYYTAAAEKIDQYQTELNQFKRLLLLNSSSSSSSSSPSSSTSSQPTAKHQDQLDEFDLSEVDVMQRQRAMHSPHQHKQHVIQHKASSFLFDDEPYLPVIEEDKETVYSLDEQQSPHSHTLPAATRFASDQALRCDSSEDEDDDDDDDADLDDDDDDYFGEAAQHREDIEMEIEENALDAIQHAWSSSPAYYAAFKNSFAEHSHGHSHSHSRHGNQFDQFAFGALDDNTHSHSHSHSMALDVNTTEHLATAAPMERGHSCSSSSTSSLFVVYIEEQTVGASFHHSGDETVVSSIFGTDEQQLVYVLVTVGGIDRSCIEHIQFKQNYKGCYYALVHIRCASLSLINCMMNRMKAKFANNIDIFKMQSLQLLENEDEQFLINRS